MQIVEAFQSIIMIYLAYLQWRKQDFVFDLGIMAPITPAYLSVINRKEG